MLGTLALVKLGLHLATSEGYGHFRDELYYLASTEHMAWGHVDHPPLSIALLWLSRALPGDSLLAVRFLPAVAGSATVHVAGLFARELGGGARAQGLAALCVLTTSRIGVASPPRSLFDRISTTRTQRKRSSKLLCSIILSHVQPRLSDKGPTEG